MPYLSVNGVNLYYEEHGEGPPLLLIAGLASDSQSWLPVIDGLSKHFRVIVPDNRGCGRTKPMDIEITIRKIADDCIMLINHLGITSVNVAGHSMGGFVALDCALRHSEYISKTVIVSSSAYCSQRNKLLLSGWYEYMKNGMLPELWYKNLFYWIFSENFFEDESLLENAVELAVQYPFQQTEKAFKAQIEAISNFNCVGSLKRITSRTLALFGRDDLLFPPGIHADVLKKIPEITVSVMDGAAHSIHVQKPQEFVSIVAAFLN